MDPQEGWPKAEAALSKALELDPRLPEARHLRASIQWHYRRDSSGAETDFRSAIQLKANDAEVHNHYATFLLTQGRFDEAFSEIRRALDLDPLSTRYISDLAQIYYFARRYNEAIGQYRQALELDPKDALVHEWLGDACQRVGDERGALAEWRTALTLRGDAALAKRISEISATRGFAAAVRALGAEQPRKVHSAEEPRRVCAGHRLCPRLLQPESSGKRHTVAGKGLPRTEPICVLP